MDLTAIKIGTTPDYRPVRWKNRYTHCLNMGKSGGGKSTLIEYCVFGDSFLPTSKIVVDPSGTLAEPSHSMLRGKAHYLSLKNPLSINLMKLPYNPNVISSVAKECINQTISALTPNNPFTAKMTSVFDAAVKYCLEHQRYSLINVRDWILNQKGDNEARDGIISRLNMLLSDERIIPILCGNDSINLADLINSGKSLIVDCKGMTPEQFVFLGTLVTQALVAYMRYENLVRYKPVSVYIDECHLFVRHSFLQILKEGRRYKISAMLATQDFAVIDESIKRVMLNVGSLIAFRLGANEASYFAREMSCSVEDIMYLPKYHFMYLTEEGKGIAKAPGKLFVKPIPIKHVKPKEKPQSVWFPLEPYQPASP